MKVFRNIFPTQQFSKESKLNHAVVIQLKGNVIKFKNHFLKEEKNNGENIV